MSTDETRFFAGEPQKHETQVLAGGPPPPPPPVPRIPSRMERLAAGLFRRLLAATAVASFCFFAWSDWWPAWYFRNKYDPPHSLGPLYFLVNASPTDDWIGYLLLPAVVLGFAPFVVWPRRWTAWLAWLVALGWVLWARGDWVQRDQAGDTLPPELRGTWPLLTMILIGAGVALAWRRALRMTVANFARVREGMSREEAVAMVGPPGDYAAWRKSEPFPPSFARPGQTFWRTDEGVFAVEVSSTPPPGVISRKSFWPAHPPESSGIRHLLWGIFWWLRTFTR